MNTVNNLLINALEWNNSIIIGGGRGLTMSSSGRKSNNEDSFRRAALEYRELLRRKMVSIDSVWNAAIYECMSMFGQACGQVHRGTECQKCWIHGKLRGALRLEASVYMPLKDRMLSSLARIRRTCTLEGIEHAAYMQALIDIEHEIDAVVDGAE